MQVDKAAFTVKRVSRTVYPETILGSLADSGNSRPPVLHAVAVEDQHFEDFYSYLPTYLLLCITKSAFCFLL